VQCLAQRGEYSKIVAYNQQVGHAMDYQVLLNQLVFGNPAGAVDFAKALATAEGGPLIDLQAATETFLSANAIQEATSFLLEALKPDKAEHTFLQTKLLEINLIGGAPQIADAILQNKIFTHFDKAHVAKLCEHAGLWQRAAENFKDIGDIKRTFKNSHAVVSQRGAREGKDGWFSGPTNTPCRTPSSSSRFSPPSRRTTPLC